jgi:hypothetical protein
MAISNRCCKQFLTWNNHGLSHVISKMLLFSTLAAVQNPQAHDLVPVTLCRHHGRPALITDTK